MARIISFASGKGGTGKTTVVANLGTAAARLGRETLVLDADIPMANLSLVLGLDVKRATLHEVFAGEAKLTRAIYTGPEGVKIVPSGISLDGLRKTDPSKMGKVVKSLALRRDILLIDGPSGLGHDAVLALKLSKELILVINPDIASLSDAFKTKIIAERLRVKPIGVVVTRATGEDADISEEEIKSMLELPILVVIPEDPEVRRSAAFGEPVVIRKPKSPSAKAFRDLAKELFVEEKS